ncbi:MULTISPECIES: Na/Pi symporter [Bacillaceae]|uniref:Na/Pi symporter n=1 Tax=Bacillaceae TaxID=186817 RepID=UPI001E40224C|nr:MULTISPECIES: Na/Pi symporter [Bacillaceae]MCE4046996.1 Na/Pi symporter [Bacillus sp. Au-Bac7]MCM3030100.1 Na/Pi symporter [Niallia sp. MER 6]MDL0436549.1 Na/Pi symporter [Niallia sp. SS-2023]UPO86618.1 Na/Pi symporter [Niallia sp. Man26]
MLYIGLFIIMILLFIYGMTLLRTGLFNLSSHSLKALLEKLTNKPWKGMVAAIIITAVLQSSSAVMVLTIGLIAARVLTFPQSIGIILGTNIGTTFTTEFITYDISDFLLPLAIIGAVFILVNKHKLRSIGFVLFGIAIVFTAMKGFKHFASIIQDNPFMQTFLAHLSDRIILALAVGILLTALIQSSTATIGIIMGFLTADMLSIEAGIAIMLGSNIGTCITSYLASIGAEKQAKLCAYAHIWLNVGGVLLFYPFIGQLTDAVEYMTSAKDVQLAHASLLFNVLSSILVLPFAEQFGKWIMKLHKV